MSTHFIYTLCIYFFDFLRQWCLIIDKVYTNVVKRQQSLLANYQVDHPGTPWPTVLETEVQTTKRAIDLNIV